MARLMICLIISASLCTACSRLSKSENTLRHNYLAITPPGTDMDRAVQLIKQRIKPEGALLVRNNTPCLEREATSAQIGVHSIKVNLGWYYWGVMQTPVIGEWCFNDEKKLVDIVVRKQLDDSGGIYNTEHSPY